jgi:hypothetical protein
MKYEARILTVAKALGIRVYKVVRRTNDSKNAKHEHTTKLLLPAFAAGLSHGSHGDGCKRIVTRMRHAYCGFPR